MNMGATTKTRTPRAKAKQTEPVVETPTFATREEWLTAAIRELRALCKQQGGFDVPEVRVSVGFPKTRKATTVGQYWQTMCAADSQGQVFIHPKVHVATEALAILLHELIHASDNGASAHKGEFIKRMRAMGMVAPWTSSTPGDDTRVVLATISDELGEYPHAALNVLEGPVKDKTQKTYMVKMICPVDECGYLVRMTQKWLDDVGAPICPAHMGSMEVAL